MVKQNLTKLIDEYGISLEAPTEVNVSMKQGLARMHADVGLRTYLENAVRIANHNLIKSLDNGETTKAMYFANRIETIILLLKTSKVWFANSEKLKQVDVRGGTL